MTIAALADQLLTTTMAELKAAYPKLEFRSCPVDFGSAAYMDDIREATKDIPISLVFNNAGCTCVSRVKLTHSLWRSFFVTDIDFVC